MGESSNASLISIYIPCAYQQRDALQCEENDSVEQVRMDPGVIIVGYDSNSDRLRNRSLFPESLGKTLIQGKQIDLVKIKMAFFT